ncbi:MAG TPA: hypothetical protein VFX96_05100 [Pyrinomonadaceae bacterium]|nr:hypothetical protein [Pyrinomonadaceae bacterium]
MSGLRAGSLPAFVLASLIVAAAGQLSASAQSATQLADAGRAVPASARLTPTEREFFDTRTQTLTWEREMPVSQKGCSCVVMLPSDALGNNIDNNVVADARNSIVIANAGDDAVRRQQQPTTVNQATYTPLTPGQKMRRAARNAFLSPTGYLRTAISATITEATEEDLPHKDTDDRVADGLSRFAIKFSSRATRTLLGSGVYPVLFKQDPRYERSTSKNIARRALHAASRVFVTRGDGGGLQPNYSRFAGAFSASALSNLWEQSTPGRDRIGWDATARRFVSSFPDDMLNNILFREFLPDIIKIFRRK